tara:strand:+ start:5085 stop:5279 length:195 start_codon:yes stop_codon:yes gene_type:complete
MSKHYLFEAECQKGTETKIILLRAIDVEQVARLVQRRGWSYVTIFECIDQSVEVDSSKELGKLT